MYLRAFLLLAVVACGGKSAELTAGSPKTRLLESDDPELRPAIVAAARSLFYSTGLGYPVSSGLRDVGADGVYVRGKRHEFLSAEVKAIAAARSHEAATKRPPTCDVESAERITLNPPPPPSDPAAPGRTGAAPAPPASSSTPRQTDARCNAPSGVTLYAFTAVRVAGDTAYVETSARGNSRAKHCIVLAQTWPLGQWSPVPVDKDRRRNDRCGR